MANMRRDFFKTKVTRTVRKVGGMAWFLDAHTSGSALGGPRPFFYSITMPTHRVRHVRLKSWPTAVYEFDKNLHMNYDARPYV